MLDWSLVLLILFAIALPGILLLRFFPFMQVVEARLQGSPSPRWQVHLASVLPILYLVFFFVGGTAALIPVLIWPFEWSLLATALVFYLWSGRAALQLALLRGKGDPASISRMSLRVQAVGYLVAGFCYLVVFLPKSGGGLCPASRFSGSEPSFCSS